jgi:HPt (histidine-containing phosphotransfer) domain-containing protein
VDEDAAGPATASVFDPDLALARCFDSEKMVRNIAEIFSAEREGLLTDMRAALSNGNLEQLSRLGHRLKGTVAYLGAQPATDAADRLEQFSVASAEEAVGLLEIECEALAAALRKHALEDTAVGVELQRRS